MNWFFSLVKIAGASFPVSASLVQLQAELTSAEFEKRLDALTDPISFLHEDIGRLSRHLYLRMKETNKTSLQFDGGFYSKFGRPLAVLDAHGYIKAMHGLGAPYAAGLRITDPTFIIYLAYHFEDKENMETVHGIVDNCKPNQWLLGAEIKSLVDVPIPVIRAVFEIYESNGYGLLSREIGSCAYMGSV